jgi:CRISPR-associated protein Cmr5
MKKRIEQMIPLAMDAIEDHFTEDGELKPIPKTFLGSISSMGASVLQMGLLATLAVFSNPDSAARDDQRTRLLDIISEVLSNYEGYEDKKLFQDRENESVLKLAAKMNKDQQKKLKSFLLDAAVAVKLSLRTFQLEES